MRSVVVLALILLAPGCIGTAASLTTTDAGADASLGAADGSTDASVDAGVDAPSSNTCVFGTSHFADGCKFGP